MTEYVTKDSGERAQFDSGMQRDTEKGKPRFDLMLAEGVPYGEQMITRFAALLGRGAEKYKDRNWEQADSEAEIARMKSSAFRHLMQLMTGETDEDHAAAVIFNVLAMETTRYKMEKAEREELDIQTRRARFQDIATSYGPKVDAINELAEAHRVISEANDDEITISSNDFVHPDQKVTSVSTPSEMVKKLEGMGYTAEEAQAVRNQQTAYAPDPQQVKDQIQIHFNGGETSQGDINLARLFEENHIATRQMRQRRGGW